VGEKERYQQELRTQLDAWKKDVAKLKSISAKASLDARAAMQQNIAVLESRIEEGGNKLSEIAGASDEAWDSIRKDVESSWSALKKAYSDVAEKFRG